MTRACIYCGSQELSKSIAHIVPESLGGASSPIAPPGIICDGCNQYFGQKVESLALASFPFVGLRLLMGIPTKKGRMVSTPSTLGKIYASGMPGRIEVEPHSEKLADLIKQGSVNQFRLIAEVTEPLAVCRMLLKIGLELLGKHYYEVAISDRVSEARSFARRPSRGKKWWFVLHSDPSELFASFAGSSCPPWEIEIRELHGILHSTIRMPSANVLIPLEGGTAPPSESELPEPLYRIVWAVC